jgi:hypothetical protein
MRDQPSPVTGAIVVTDIVAQPPRWLCIADREGGITRELPPRTSPQGPGDLSDVPSRASDKLTRAHA